MFTDPLASPTGFPFKVAQLEGTLSDDGVYTARPRICDLGFLREAYRTAEGKVDFRCPGEPVTLYVSKGGKLENTAGRKCLCNALVANIGHAQIRNGKHVEPGMITSGDDLRNIPQFLAANALSYSAADVIGKIAGAGEGLFAADFADKRISHDNAKDANGHPSQGKTFAADCADGRR